MRRLRCRIGFHKWEQSRDLSLMDTFPPPFVPYDNPTRHCILCLKKQRWLPGYGGSEFGCWLNA